MSILSSSCFEPSALRRWRVNSPKVEVLHVVHPGAGAFNALEGFAPAESEIGKAGQHLRRHLVCRDEIRRDAVGDQDIYLLVLAPLATTPWTANSLFAGGKSRTFSPQTALSETKGTTSWPK